MKTDLLTCERCLYNGMKKEHTPTVANSIWQLPLDVREEQEQILYAAMAVPSDLLGLSIPDARVTLTRRLQLELPLDMGVSHKTCKHLGVPSSFLKKNEYQTKFTLRSPNLSQEIAEARERIIAAYGIPKKYFGKKGNP